MRVTLDASVWLAASSPREREHLPCATLVRRLLERRVALHQPGLFLIEVSASVARRTRDEAMALEAAGKARSMPGMVIHELTLAARTDATDVAARCALRGADAVYVTTARHAQATLVTMDREVRERAGTIVPVRTPAEWLKELA